MCFCILLGSRDIRKNIKRSLSVNLRIFKNRRNDNENLRLLPGRFSPTYDLLSAVDYLEAKLLRFQALICRINDFCVLLSFRDIVNFVNFQFSVKLRICKKNSSKLQFMNFISLIQTKEKDMHINTLKKAVQMAG